MKKFFALTLAVTLGSAAASLFLSILNLTVEIFQNNWNFLIWLTPIASLVLGWFIHHPFFRKCEVEHSTRLAPFTFISACWSHLFGASTGRETAAVLIGNSVTETIRRKFRLQDHDRDHFMAAGTAAAFSAAMGLPFSSILFALEYRKKWDLTSLLYSCFASLIGFTVTYFLHTPHWHPQGIFEIQYSEINWVGFSIVSFLVVFISYVIFFTEKQVENKLFSVSGSKKLFISGTIIATATLVVGSTKYSNFGVPLLDASLLNTSSFQDLILKLIFIEISLLGLWKGGVFVPYMCIGAMLGSYLSGFFAVSASMTGAGFAMFALINLKLKIPITSIFLTSELFGWRIGILSIPIHLLLGFSQKLKLKHLS